MSIIEFSRVSFGYPNKPILKDFSIEIEANSFWTVIGPNGSGKSTLLNLLCGFLKTQQGHIDIDGKPVSDYGYRQRARMLSLVQQEFVPAFEYTVTEIVMMARYSCQKNKIFESDNDRRVVHSALAATDTLDFSERPLGFLSGGERQRVFIARALAQETPIFLLDEPTSHLDIKHQIRIFDLLKDMQLTQRKTIVLVTHDLNLASQYCDRVILMGPEGGSIQGCPEAVINAENIRSYFGVNGHYGRLEKENFFLPLGTFSKDRRND